MEFLRTKDIAIAGVADVKNVRKSGRSALSLAAEAMTQLVAATGLDRGEIDGLAVTLSLSEPNPFWTNLVAETLGLSLSWVQATDIGGASAIGNVARAAGAIKAGLCHTVLCLNADAPSTQDLFVQNGYRTEFLDPMGYSGPPVVFGLLSSAYRACHGLPEDALAKLAVAQRSGAMRNPITCDTFRKPLTADDYLTSRMIADPIRVLDCVMRCDGANALLVMSTERAKALGVKRLVHPVAYRERTNFDPSQQIDDITVSGFSQVGPAALADAGMTPGDVRSFHPYDDFLIAVLLQLEQIGFAGAGRGGAFMLEHDIGFAGEFPINSGGGQISCGQPGLAGGGINLVEAVKQLTGTAGERQGRASNAMVTGIGAMQYARNWGTSAVLMLEAG